MASNVYAWDLFVSRLPEGGEMFGDYTLYHEAVDEHTGHNILQVNLPDDAASLFLVPGNPAIPGYTHTLYVYSGCPDADGEIVYSDIMVWGELDVGTPVYASFWENLVCRIPAMAFYPNGKAGLTASTYTRYLRNIDWSFAAYCPFLVPGYTPPEDDEEVEGNVETVSRYHRWRPAYGTTCDTGNLFYALDNRPWEFGAGVSSQTSFASLTEWDADAQIYYIDRYRCDPLPEEVYEDEYYYWTLAPGKPCDVGDLEAAIAGGGTGITDAPDGTVGDFTFSETEEGAGPDGDQTVITFSHYKCVFTDFPDDFEPAAVNNCQNNFYLTYTNWWTVDPTTVCNKSTYDWFVANKVEDIQTVPSAPPGTEDFKFTVTTKSGVLTCYHVTVKVWCRPRVPGREDPRPGGQ